VNIIRKTKNFFGLGWLILFLALVWAGNASAEWTPNDDGEMVWWEPPVTFESMRIAPLNVDTLQENQGEINAEIIFAMDTSGSMSDEFDVLCNRITEIINGVANAGINIGSHIYGIRYNRNCTENTVYNVVVNNGATPTVNHSEDWGPAIVDLSEHYSWPSGHVRIVIPMSDESAQNGGSWDSADEQAANDAIDAAVNNSVLIIPVLCSGYNQGMLTAAQRMAQTTHGRYFTSTSPVNDLVDGIVNAIKDAIGSIEITGIYPYPYIDDAWEDPENTTVYKLSGDIVQLVCQINNNSDKDVTAKLTFEYPDNWNLSEVNNSTFLAIRKRDSMENVEENIDGTYIDDSENGRVSISNIFVPAKSGNQTGRSEDYLIKLRIPTNNAAPDSPELSFKVEWDNTNDPNGQRFETSEKKLNTVAVTKKNKRFIMTNRVQLYERYADGFGPSSTERANVNRILGNLYRLASQQKAYIFYVDRWDIFDDFSTKNPAGNPIAYWDREEYYGCSGSGTSYACTEYSSMNENDLNVVATAIDDYIHYWADQTGGKSNPHWLLIVGDDKVIPFYRATDPTPAPSWTESDSEAYDASEHTEEMAEENWIFTESLYQDTDGSGWGVGKVDFMYTGRLVSDSAANLNSMIETYIRILKDSNSISSEGVTLTSGTDSRCWWIDTFRTTMREAEPYFTNAGYSITCQNDGTCGNDCKSGTWSEGCLYGCEKVTTGNDCTGDTWNFDDLVLSVINAYNDHGLPRSTNNFSGTDFIFCPINSPTFHLFTCLCGLVDGNDSSLMTYSLLNSQFSTVLAATTETSIGHDSVFIKKFYEKLTGQVNEGKNWQSKTPSTIGEALNEAKRAADSDAYYDLSNFAFTLYGVPWISYEPTSSSKMSVSTLEISELNERPLISSLGTPFELQKDVNIDIADDEYRVTEAYGFQFIEIEDFSKYTHDQKIIFPFKRVEIDLPLDTIVTSVSIAGLDSVALGPVNLPVFNEVAPPKHDPIYSETPASYGFVDLINNPIWFVNIGPLTKSVVVNVVPITFDASTKDTTLYKNVILTVNYETNQKGILVSASTDKPSYNTGDQVIAEVKIENTSSEAAQFSVCGKISTVLGNEIGVQNGATTINAGELGDVYLNFGTISTVGSYFLEIEAYGSNGKIGAIQTQFSVSSGKITDFTVPESTAPDETANFAISFNNSGGETLKGTFKTILYKNSQFIGETNPVVIEIPSGQTETANFQWNVPDDFCGEYLALASVVFPDGSDSMSKDFYITSNNLPIADGGPDKKVEVDVGCMGTVTLDGSGSSDPEGNPLIYTWTWNGSSANGVSPTIQLPLGTTTITLVVNNGTEDSEPDKVDITVKDTIPPATQIISPVSNGALQDGVILTADASDVCDVTKVYFYVREADGGSGSPIGYEDLSGAYNGTSWECNFDTNTPLTPDGYYVILTKAVDTNGNEGWSTPVPVSIRNWAVIELLPNTANNKAGRTMPVKFALRIAAAVDPAQPFVYNQELEIRIYDASAPDTILQTSLYGGDSSTDYRIDTAGELYITNFKTSKTPADYVVEIWRMSKNFLVGSFTFETVK